MLNFENAIVYDIETYPNCITFAMEMLNKDVKCVWEISEFRDDRKQLLSFFQELARTQTPMIGYNNIGFDYPVIHLLWKYPNSTYKELYAKAQSIIDGGDRFGHVIWANDRFAPQIDLYKMHHFDNPAKATSLKTLEINMRSDFVQDLPIKDGSVLTKEQIDNILLPYNMHDVSETKRFAHFAHRAFEFRQGLESQFGIDVYNWNDPKIGEQTILSRLDEDVCYEKNPITGKKTMRQTPRNKIPLSEIMFPYIQINRPQFKNIYDYLMNQTLRSEDLGDLENPKIKTKGVFTDLNTIVDGVQYNYGSGGIHGSVEKKRIFAGNGYIIKDIDVGSLYPSIAISNGLYPEHLGSQFVTIYDNLKKERKKWQKEKGKKCTEANAIKLALNGAYGKSNSVYSVFFDPKFTMTITINGQMLLTMLLDQLLNVPTISIIQVNTDGITYYIHEDYEPMARKICDEWEVLTRLSLEHAQYSAMYIRDVNSYIAIGVDGGRKLKGAYWTPDPLKYHDSIAEAQPPAWHKNLSNLVSVRAAVANMTDGTDIETYIKNCLNPFEFCCAVKVKRSDQLLCGDVPVQRNTRFYVSKDGNILTKKMPPAGPVGQYKRKNGVSEQEYNRVMAETNGEWDERVCTGNKSKYEDRVQGLIAGYRVTVVNDIRNFSFDNIDYDWYVEEAKKLII